MTSKKEIRREILKARRAMPASQVQELSTIICDNISRSKAYNDATDICLYMPINNEADVTLMMDKAIADGKRTWLPCVRGSEMEFHYYDQNTPMIVGDFNIMEPDSDEILVADDKVLVIMPGAVFSVDRDRIGYGGGFYDRYLEKNSAVKTLAACFDMQILDSIPSEPHDIKPQALVSEIRIIEE